MFQNAYVAFFRSAQYSKRVAFTFADLFSGIGGFHSALKSRGGRNVFFSEIDVVASEVYKLNWVSNSRKFAPVMIPDVRDAAIRAKRAVPDHQVLTAGFPCQPFSKSGKQEGVNDRRGTLFHDILEIAHAKQPDLILLENVRNLIGPKHISDYVQMLMMLREEGYAVSSEPTVLSPHEIPEQSGGTPQHRQRLFIAAFRVGKAKAKKAIDLPPLLDKSNLPLEKPSSWDLKEFLANNTVKAGGNEIVRLNSSQLDALNAWQEFLVLYRRFNKGEELPGLPLWSDFWNERNHIPSDTPDWKRTFIRRNQQLYLANQSWIDKWRAATGIEEHIPSFRKFEWQAQDSKSIWRCLIQFRPSGIRVKVPNYVPTFVAMAQTPYLGWEKRALTAGEAAVLQGFPEAFDFGDQSLSATMKQIGNAVHPGVVGVVFDSAMKQAKSLGIELR